MLPKRSGALLKLCYLPNLGRQPEGERLVIAGDVARFLEGHVMILVATRDAGLRPHIGRGTGARFDRSSGQIRLFVSSSQWTGAVGNAIPGTSVAATFVKPDDYRCYQIKGMIDEVRPATGSEQALGTRYVEEMLLVMGALGVSRLQLSSTLVDRDLAAISFTPTDLFVQTPGPDAGQRLSAGERR